MKTVMIVVAMLAFGCAGSEKDPVPNLPSGPAEIQVRIVNLETHAVYFETKHSWEDLDAFTKPFAGEPYTISAIELDPNPDAGAPWVKPIGGFAPIDGCVRIIQ